MPKSFADPTKAKVSTKWKLPAKHREVFDFYDERKEELLQSRKNVNGTDLDALFGDIEKNYIPHRVNVEYPHTVDNSQPNLYIKVSTALSIVLSTNFDADTQPAKEKYRPNNKLIRGLYLHSLDPQISSTRQQYFNAAFNVSMFGSGGLRTYRRFQEAMVWDDAMENRKPVVDMDEVDAKALHPRDYWIDDGAVPGDRRSHTDWMWREVYSYRTLRRIFPESMFPNIKYIGPGGDTQQHLGGATVKNTGNGDKAGRGVEVYFYENRLEDLFICESQGIPFSITPMPNRRRNLSLSHGIWTLRSTTTGYGLGLWEIISQDQQLIDMVRDMSIEQLVLSIFSVIFHDGTNKIDEEKLKVAAGKFIKLLNPDKLKQFQLSGPGQEVIRFIEKFQQDMDDASGVSKVLTGEQLGNTAFEANLNQEAGLRRLKLPSNNLKELFEWEAANRITLIKQLYSQPKVEQVSDPEAIEAFKQEFASGKRDSDDFYVDSEDRFFRKEYREVEMELEEDENGNFVSSKESRFITIKPNHLEWEGFVRIKLDSLLVPSETLEKERKLELARILGPFLQAMAQNESTAAIFVPFLKPIIKAMKEDPEEWIAPQLLAVADKAAAEQDAKERMDQKLKDQEQPAPNQPAASVPPTAALAGAAPETATTEAPPTVEDQSPLDAA